MSARHIEQHYGFGAARIAIRSEMHRVSRQGFREDLDAMLAEAGAGGPGAVVRRFAGAGLGLVAILGVLGFVIAGLARQEAERQALEVVMLEAAPPPVVPPMVELPVEPEPIVPEPVVPEPVKPEPPPMVAKVEPPPPPPPVAPPKPEPVRVKPEIAKLEPPPVVPVERMERAVRERPVPVERPKVQIEAVAVRPDRVAPAPQPERVARNTVRPDARSMPRMAAPAAPAIDVPSEAAPERAFRVAAARAPSAPRGRPIAGVAPAGISAPDMDMPTTRGAPTRGSAAPRPTPSAAGARSVPRLEMAAAPVAPSPRSLEVPSVVARAERAAPASGGVGGGGNARPGVSGVPLGELQACVTDREEDRLKGAVVAAVKSQGECVSSKGTYRFVETKNVNAFLMWIDRAPSRRVEDRCAELRYALECLQGGNRHASR
jgi:protein TonB